MKQNFRNKKILITGATSGIGKNILLKMDKVFDNSIFYVVARNKSKFDNFSFKLINDFEFINFDLKNFSSADELIKKIDFSKIDILINNAGYALSSLPGTTSNEDVVQLNNVNVIFPTIIMNEFLLKNKDPKSEKILINVGSLAGYFPNHTDPYYSSSKAFINNLTLSLKKYNEHNSLYIKLFVPGLTHTEFFEKSRYTMSHKFPRLLGQSPEKAADYLVKNLHTKKYLLVPKLINKIILRLIKIYNIFI